MMEKKEGKKQEEERKQGVERGGDDASCHEGSLVTAVTEKATDNRDYNYSFQQSSALHASRLLCSISFSTWLHLGS